MKKIKRDTVRIVETALQSDPNVSELQKKQVKAVLKGNKPPVQQVLLTQQEAARWLNVTRQTVYTPTVKGFLKPCVIGKSIKRYRLKDLEKMAGLTSGKK